MDCWLNGSAFRVLALGTGSRHDKVAPGRGGRKYSVVGEPVLAWMGDQGGESFQEDERIEYDMCCTVAPGMAELEQDATTFVQREPFARERGTTNVPCQMLQPLALVRRYTHLRVQREPVERCAEVAGRS